MCASWWLPRVALRFVFRRGGWAFLLLWALHYSALVASLRVEVGGELFEGKQHTIPLRQVARTPEEEVRYHTVLHKAQNFDHDNKKGRRKLRTSAPLLRPLFMVVIMIISLL